MAIRKIKLTIAYDGFSYHGWQEQPGHPTIEQTIEDALQNLTGQKVELSGASRTDAGVSALGQVATFQIDSPIPTENFTKAITHRLPPDIAIIEAAEVPLDFDVIKDVKSKLYRYTIFMGEVRPVLQIRHCWHIPEKLDVAAMPKAASFLVGKKDFKSFAAAADKRESSVRTISRCDISTEDSWIYIDVEGDGFLYNMVRNIVGTLVEAGAGRMKPEKMLEILKAKDRTAAGPIAPAEGLCLLWIKY
jgi:tRNA pseudouridine38-40 synthase